MMLGRHLLGNGAPAKPGDSWTFTTSDVFAVPVTGTYEVTLVGGGGRGGAGGTGGSGYGAGGGGGGGVPATQDRNIGQGGNGAPGIAVIKYLGR